MERQGLLKRQQLNGRQWYVLPPDSPHGEAHPPEDEETEREAAHADEP
jgi:hypothetical protein